MFEKILGLFGGGSNEVTAKEIEPVKEVSVVKEPEKTVIQEPVEKR